jgi:hypothetical protein
MAFCPNCGAQVGGAGAFCASCGKPLSTVSSSTMPYPTNSKRPRSKRNLAIAIGAIFLLLIGMKSCGDSSEQPDVAVPDDAATLISKCGSPNVDDSTANDNPRPPLPVRMLEYKSENIRFSFIPGGNVKLGTPPPYRWKFLAVQDTETNQPIDIQIASKRMPCAFKQ